MKLLSIVGARPQFIKLAPLLQAIDRYNLHASASLEHVTLHTGQHYDNNMSDIFFEELEMPHAEVNLGVGSGPHGKQTGKMLEGIEEILQREKPDWLIIFGDTNSTVAGALAAAKLHIPVAHIEAGLRSFNRKMPEEINRVVSDHISDILLAPTPTAVKNLEVEGLAKKTVLTGDIMYDTVLRNVELSRKKSDVLSRESLADQSYYIATMHRAENTDDPTRLGAIMNCFNEMADRHHPVVFPMHPRTKHRIEQLLPDWTPHKNLKILAPVGYLDMLQLVSSARIALTDSGGLQKEVFFMNRPCVTMRDETEWVETVSSGGNVITGADPEAIRQAVSNWEEKLKEGEVDFTQQIHENFGKGDAAEHILNAILN
ncbi:MAG: UDP-N-acetylglucosamine 2-epimerase (non-hydrolyzing) [Bacteroidota bacterium]